MYIQIRRGSPSYDITLKGDGSGCCFPFHSGYELRNYSTLFVLTMLTPLAVCLFLIYAQQDLLRGLFVGRRSLLQNPFFSQKSLYTDSKNLECWDHRGWADRIRQYQGGKKEEIEQQYGRTLMSTQNYYYVFVACAAFFLVIAYFYFP